MSSNLRKSSPARYRRADFDDQIRIVSQLRDEYARTNGIYKIDFCIQSALVTVEHIIRHGICVVGKRCSAGALIIPSFYNAKALVANTVFWFFKSPRDILILEVLEEACWEAGATHFVATSHPPKHIIARHYASLGMTESQAFHVKVLATRGARA